MVEDDWSVDKKQQKLADYIIEDKWVNMCGDERGESKRVKQKQIRSFAIVIMNERLFFLLFNQSKLAIGLSTCLSDCGVFVS